MEITVEMVDQVKDKTGVSYKEAKEALVRSNGDVVDAIIDIEENIGVELETAEAKTRTAITEKIKELIKKGNVSKITVKKDGEIILNLPVNVGIIGAVVAPWVSVAAVIAAFGTKCVIEVVKTDGSIIDVSDVAHDTFGVAMEKGSVIAEEIKNKGAVVYEAVKEKGEEAYETVKEKASGNKEKFDLEDDDFTFSPVDRCNCEETDDEE